MKWLGTVVVLTGKYTTKSDYVNWEIETVTKDGNEIVDSINRKYISSY